MSIMHTGSGLADPSLPADGIPAFVNAECETGDWALPVLLAPDGGGSGLTVLSQDTSGCSTMPVFSDDRPLAHAIRFDIAMI
jgi:hypothetical protein